MKTVSLIGFAKSGKSTLACALAEQFEARGLRVALAKHSHHPLDKAGTDTARFCTPGRQVIGLGPDGCTLFYGQARYLLDLLPLLEADLLLVEGGKSLGWLPRVLCLHPANTASTNAASPSANAVSARHNDLALLRPELAFAVYEADGPSGQLAHLPHFGPHTLNALADQIFEHAFTLPGLNCGACGQPDCAGLTARIVAGKASVGDCRALAGRLEVLVGGQPLGLNSFTAGILEGGVRGMLAQLKGYAPGREIVLRLKA